MTRIKACLPSATVVAERLCFHRCLSVHGGELYIPHGQTPHPPARHPLGRHPPGQTATAADGTHPTGMHSCFKFSFLFLQDILCRNQLELLKLLNVSCYAVQDILKVACEACATKPMKVGKKNREVAEYICLKHVLLMT